MDYLKKIAMLVFTAGILMSACSEPQEKKPIYTRAPDAYSSLSPSQLEERAEKATVSYNINASCDRWPQAAESLAEAVRSYNSIQRFHPLSPEAKRHQDKLKMQYDGDEIKLDALLQEGGEGSVIQIGDYSVEIEEKKERTDMDGKPSDYEAKLSLRYKGDTMDLNRLPFIDTRWVNITADDIYLSDLVRDDR